MKRMRRVVAAAGLAVAGVAGTVAFAGSAAADTVEAAAYNGACGSGYTVVDSANIGTQGTVFLTWSESTGENCVVTVRTTPGAAVYMQAKVFQTAHTEVSASDSGQYTTYAGPVYVPGRGECVTWRGQIGDAYVESQGHCG